MLIATAVATSIREHVFPHEMTEPPPTNVTPVGPTTRDEDSISEPMRHPEERPHEPRKQYTHYDVQNRDKDKWTECRDIV